LRSFFERPGPAALGLRLAISAASPADIPRGLVPGEGTTVMTKRTWILGMKAAKTRAFAALLALSLASAHQRAFAFDAIELAAENVSDDLAALAETVSPDAMV